MKDRDHLSRHGSRHPEGDAKLLGVQMLRMARHSVWTQAKHPDGLERPTFSRTIRTTCSVCVTVLPSIRHVFLDRFAVAGGHSHWLIGASSDKYRYSRQAS